MLLMPPPSVLVSTIGHFHNNLHFVSIGCLARGTCRHHAICFNLCGRNYHFINSSLPKICSDLFPGEVFPGEVFPGEVFPEEVFPGEVFPGEVFCISCSQLNIRTHFMCDCCPLGAL